MKRLCTINFHVRQKSKKMARKYILVKSSSYEITGLGYNSTPSWHISNNELSKLQKYKLRNI